MKYKLYVTDIYNKNFISVFIVLQFKQPYGFYCENIAVTIENIFNLTLVKSFAHIRTYLLVDNICYIFSKYKQSNI